MRRFDPTGRCYLELLHGPPVGIEDQPPSFAVGWALAYVDDGEGPSEGGASATLASAGYVILSAEAIPLSAQRRSLLRVFRISQAPSK